MTEDEKRMFDSLKSLADFWWERFDKRVIYNWKVALSIWGVLVAYIGIIIKTNLVFSYSCYFSTSVIIIGLIIVWAHIKYIIGSTKSHRIDRMLFNEYEQRYMDLINHRHGEKVRFLIDNAKEEQTSLTHWANSFLWIITTLLVIIAVSITLFIGSK